MKSLTAFPDVLTMMNDELDWTQKLGDAFLAQQSDVMDAVQVLRNKAKAQGNLESNKQQKVIVEQPPGGRAGDDHDHQDRAGEPAGRLRPDLQPHRRLRRVAVPRLSAVLLLPARLRRGGVGHLVRRRARGRRGALGQLQLGLGTRRLLRRYYGRGGNYYGGNNNVNVNVNRYNNFNRTNIQNSNWQHNSAHRKGVQYRDRSIAGPLRQGRATGRRFARGVPRSRGAGSPADRARTAAPGRAATSTRPAAPASATGAADRANAGNRAGRRKPSRARRAERSDRRQSRQRGESRQRSQSRRAATAAAPPTAGGADSSRVARRVQRPGQRPPGATRIESRQREPARARRRAAQQRRSAAGAAASQRQWRRRSSRWRRRRRRRPSRRRRRRAAVMTTIIAARRRTKSGPHSTQPHLGRIPR